MTTAELSEASGVSKAAILYWTRSGAVPAIRHSNGKGQPNKYDDRALATVFAIKAAGGLRHYTALRAAGPKRGLLSATEIVGATPLTYRQLDYWTRSGLLEPIVDAEGSGSMRLYAANTIELIDNLLARIAACPFTHKDGT